MISVRDLSVSYGEFRLQNIDLELREGGCLAVLGPSGAGKTLLLETVMGARKPENGAVYLNGKEITSYPPEARNIAYIPQDLALFPHLSVRDNITFGLHERRALSDSHERLQVIAKLLGIQHLLSRKRIQTLSGGEKQRVAIARALITEPRVLFLDEPLSSLDGSAARELLQLLRKMRQELKPTLFLVSHDLTEVCFLADDVAIVIDGKIVEKGPLRSVVRSPRTIAAAQFLNVRNIFRLETLPEPIAGLVTEALPGCTTVAIRPEDISISKDTNSDRFRAQVKDVVLLDSYSIVTLAIGRTALEAHCEPELGLSPGQTVGIRIASNSFLRLEE